MLRLFILFVLIGLGAAGKAAADPCAAIPEGGPAPTYAVFGATFSGKVVQILEGDVFCIAIGEGPENWVEVRLGDFYALKTGAAAARAKAALEHLALGKEATCVANLQSGDRVAARCSIDGRSIGDSLIAAGLPQENLGSVVPAARRGGSTSAGAAIANPAQDVQRGAAAFGQGVASGLQRGSSVTAVTAPLLILP